MGKIVVEKKAKKVLGDLTNEEVARLRQRSDKSLKRALHGKSILQVSKETWKSDPFSNIPVIPGVKNYKKPSIEKFLAGKTSIFSIAKSIDEEQQALNIEMKAIALLSLPSLFFFFVFLLFLLPSFASIFSRGKFKLKCSYEN